VTPRRSLDLRAPAVTAVALAALGFVPLLVRREDVLNLGVVFLLSVALAQSWNVVAGLAGQVNLGHAAFFGLGALATRSLWVAGTPIALAMAVGAVVATAAGLALGLVAFRLRGAYFAIGTLALAEVLRLSVGNALSEISTLPAATIAGYRLTARYYAALSLGVPARRLKVAAVAVSAALTAACGTLWAQYVGFVDPFYVFSVDLSVRFCLATILGGIGTPLGPFLGAALLTMLETSLRARFGGIGAGLVGIYLIIYGVVLIVMVRFAPHGLVPWIGDRLRWRPRLGPTA